MKFGRLYPALLAAMLLAVGAISATAQETNGVTSAPVFVPDYSHANQPMPAGILAWDSEDKTEEVVFGEDMAHFTFAFTNISQENVTVLSGRGSCSCTTIELPQLPWVIPPGGTGQFPVHINLSGKVGSLSKLAIISTDKGAKNLMLHVNITAPKSAPMTDEDRARGVAASKLDRQAVFKGDCVKCHAAHVEGQYGQNLFALTCAVCHEAETRASMVPDLHHLKEQTSEEFWRAWITSGKAGTLMPAFAQSQGGVLNDIQIASLAVYLNAKFPPHPAEPATQPAAK